MGRAGDPGGRGRRAWKRKEDPRVAERKPAGLWIRGLLLSAAVRTAPVIGGCADPRVGLDRPFFFPGVKADAPRLAAIWEPEDIVGEDKGRGSRQHL